MATSYSQKLLAGTLILVLVAGMTSPSFAVSINDIPISGGLVLLNTISLDINGFPSLVGMLTVIAGFIIAGIVAVEIFHLKGKEIRN